MDCADVHAAMAGSGALSAVHERHVAGCEACRVLVADGGALSLALERVEDEGAPGMDALFSRVEADLDGERGFSARIRERASPVRMGFAALAALLVPVLVFASGPRPDLSVYPAARMLLDVALFSIPAALALWLSLRPLHRPALPGWVSPALVGSAVVAMIVLAALPEAHHDHAASLQGVGEDFVARARGCFVMGTLSGIPALLWLRLSSRDAGTFAITGVLAATAALAGGLAVYLHCPIVAPGHLMAGHATVLVPYLLLALATARRR